MYKSNAGQKKSFNKNLIRLNPKRKILYVLFLSLFFYNDLTIAQGTWVQIGNPAPDVNFGVMLLLSDGTVLAKTQTGGVYGNEWDKLTPDSTGSYINGSWSVISPMQNDRLYFSSQILKDGRVYVAGGEYGTGGTVCEIYDPLTDTWTTAPPYLIIMHFMMQTQKCCQTEEYCKLYCPITTPIITPGEAI